MKIKIWVPQEIEISGELLLALAGRVREKNGLGPDAPVSMAAVLLQASAENLIELPPRARLDDDYTGHYTDDELGQTSGAVEETDYRDFEHPDEEPDEGPTTDPGFPHK